MQWYLTAVRNYAAFSGRARRAEFWLYLHFSFVIVLILYILTVLTHGFIGMLIPVYCLAMLVPSLAVLVRRLHDVDASGWWILTGLVPVVGAIGVIGIFVLTVLPGSRGPNRYGDDPKGAPDGGAVPACQ
jgi:uncharacterized membrane protein YhaH (DUF805 family)